jgi:hypothetical protein
MNVKKCQKKYRRTRILVEERSRKATFLNLQKETVVVTKVDGCVIVNGVAADWVVSRAGHGDVVIELKGKGVEHGVKQVYETALLWDREKMRVGKIAGLIVAREYPRFNTRVRRAQEVFAKTFGGPLHVVTKNYEFEMLNVLSFSGPHKE